MGMIEDAVREYATYEDRSTDPSTPASGTGLVYFKDGVLHSIDDAGAVKDYTPGGGVGGSDGATTAYKAANEVVNNSDTLQNDDDLLFAVAANEVWDFEANLWWDASAASDMQFAFTVPAGATLYWSETGLSSGGVSHNDAFVSTVSGNSRRHDAVAVGTVRHARLKGVVVNGATPGNLQFQWAQFAADASNATMRAGSALKAWKLSA